ncbi:MAG: sulfotransferase, partial [Alphaproteobacteria bacterium]
NILGEVLQAQNNLPEAFAAFDRAARSTGFAPEKALVNRGIALMEQGHKGDAEAVFEDVLIDNPRSVPAWFNFCDLHRFQPGDTRITAMESLLAPGGIEGKADRTALHFALGKAWLDAGNPDRGFAHLDNGNRRKRATFSYDAAATDCWINEIIAAFPAERLQLPRADTKGSALAVFVVGMPRSGTTLVEQILASHSDIFGAGELAALQTAVSSAGLYPASAATFAVEEEVALGEQYLEAIRPLAAHHSRVVDKMPSNFLFAGLIYRALPDARIIHVRRDPVDTCLSCYTKLFTREQQFAYNLTELGQFYRSYDRLMDHWRAVLPADRFIEVRYENVVEDLAEETRRMLAFCGLDWDPACLDFHHTERIIRTASLNQVRQPLHADSIGRWRPYAQYLAPLLDALGISAAPVAETVASEVPKVRAKRGPRLVAG